MFKLLEDLKLENKQQYIEVLKQLDNFGKSSSKGSFLKLTYPEILDLISFSDTYTFEPENYEMVLNVLADLNPIENEMIQIIKSSQPEDKKALIAKCSKMNNRTRQRVLVILDKLNTKQPASLVDHLTSFRNKVFA